MNDFLIHGMPESIPADEAAVLRSRLLRAMADAAQGGGGNDLGLLLGTHRGIERLRSSLLSAGDSGDGDSSADRARRYASTTPLWRLDQLVACRELLAELETAISLLRLEPLVFDVWGLREIEPFPRSALNFHGAPGTGKTLAAHAVASELGKRILVASYAQIESKYHGDGPKNVEAIFRAAREQDAVLFIDEADSLLSKRLTNVTQGSEQAINSMRSQILICLERHTGVVIFATNLVENYDRAFESRVRHIQFPLPDEKAREAIWRKHFPERLPLAADVDPALLAAVSADLCGRDIRNAVVDAALAVARSGGAQIACVDMTAAVDRIVAAREKVRGGAGTAASVKEALG